MVRKFYLFRINILLMLFDFIDDYLTSITDSIFIQYYTVNHRTKLTKKSVLNESVPALSLVEMFEYQFSSVDTNWKL